MDSAKLLTVSVAAYNVEEFIEECLNSFLFEAALEKCQVLIIDDGGSDGTAEIAARYEAQYPQTFHFVHKQNGGWGSTVNTGIDLAEGRYFKQLDGDDKYDKDGLSALLKTLETADADIVMTPFISFRSDTGEKLETVCASEKYGADYGKNYLVAKIGSNEAFQNSQPTGESGAHDGFDLYDKEPYKILAMHQCTFKTALLRDNRIRLLEKAFYTDTELLIKALYYTKTIYFAPEPVYLYRTMREEQSTSVRGMRKHYKEHERVVFRIAGFLESSPLEPGLEIAVNRLQMMIYNQFIFFFNLEPTVKHFLECRDFDIRLKKEYPDLYKWDTPMIRYLRKSRYLLYFYFCRKKRFG